MRRVLRIVMWCCFGLSLAATIAFAAVWLFGGAIEGIDSPMVLSLFAGPFFFVLGLNALFWSHSNSWVARVENMVARVAAIVGVVLLLAIGSIAVVFLLLLGAFFLFGSLSNLG